MLPQITEPFCWRLELDMVRLGIRKRTRDDEVQMMVTGVLHWEGYMSTDGSIAFKTAYLISGARDDALVKRGG